MLFQTRIVKWAQRKDNKNRGIEVGVDIVAYDNAQSALSRGGASRREN